MSLIFFVALFTEFEYIFKAIYIRITILNQLMKIPDMKNQLMYFQMGHESYIALKRRNRDINIHFCGTSTYIYNMCADEEN